MRINDVKLVFFVADCDIEQCAIIEIIALVEVREIVRKLAASKACVSRAGCQSLTHSFPVYKMGSTV